MCTTATGYYSGNPALSLIFSLSFGGRATQCQFLVVPGASEPLSAAATDIRTLHSVACSERHAAAAKPHASASAGPWLCLALPATMQETRAEGKLDCRRRSTSN